MDMEDENRATETSGVRIFIGGLGEGVTDDDLRRLFGSLGSVDGVEIIRTKSRSFAYVDFVPSPSDHKSLSKLFSRYNGCLWKGGKLKLEKAKEHYLARLKQEWAEDAKLASEEPGTSLDSIKSVSSIEMPSRESLKTKKLRIFFPKLQKVKTVPFSGTGKHKYSFPRVEVPPLPVHFCDCEEHSSPVATVRREHRYNSEAESGGMNDEEINIMNAVMNKLFEREKISSSMHDEKEQNFHESSGSLQSDECEGDSATDDDGLIINMETRKKKTTIIGSQELERILGNQESGSNEARILKEEPSMNKFEVQKSNNISPKKKRKSLPNLEGKNNGRMSSMPGGKRHMQTLRDEKSSGVQSTKSGDGFREPTKVSWSQKSSWRQLLGDGSKGAFNTSHILPDSNSSEEEQGSDGFYAAESNNKTEHIENKPAMTEVTEGLAEAQPTEENVASEQSGRGAAWRQKQSWTQLVGQNNNSFSISQILPGITFQKPVAKEPSMDLTIFGGGKSNGLTKHTNNESGGDGSNFMKATPEKKHDDLSKHTNSESIGHGFNLGKSTVERDQHVAGNDITPAPMVEENCETETKETSTTEIKIGETCSFMRNAASLREWAKTKAALSGSLKRKRGEKKEHLCVYS